MNRLKELRTAKGLTQQGLVNEFNEKLSDKQKPISKMNISNWENGKHSIKSDRVQELADFFKVSVAYLLGFSPKEIKDRPQDFLNTKKDEKENQRAILGYDKLITKSGITNVPEFTEKLVQTVDIEKELKKFPPVELIGMAKNKKIPEKIAKVQREKVKQELENTCIALSYLSDMESELLSLFCILNHQDKETIIKIAKALTINNLDNYPAQP